MLIEASSALSLAKSSDIDALISVKALGQTEYSKVKNDVGFEEVVWGEHFYFTKHMTVSKRPDRWMTISNVSESLFQLGITTKSSKMLWWVATS